LGLFDRFKIVEKRKKQQQLLTEGFRLITGYSPAFSTFNGSLYEMHLIRDAIDIIATHASKLKPVINGPAYKKNEIAALLQERPNLLMNTQQFIARLITMLMCDNNAFIIPIYSDNMATKIIGLYPVMSPGSKIIQEDGQLYLVYKIGNDTRAIEYERVGHLRRHYYDNELYGKSNSPMQSTAQLINTQEQGIVEGVKNGASIRLLAKLTNILNPDDMQKERDRLSKDNLSMSNNSGILIFDNKYSDIKTIDSKPFIVDDKQTEQIKTNVCNYFHVSEAIIQNKASDDEWNSFYEGCIEPIALQMGLELSKIFGYSIMFESSRLQLMKNETKLNYCQIMFDRGIISTNQVLEVWNMPPVSDGDKRYIRKEYIEVNLIGKDEEGEGKNGQGKDNREEV